MAAALVILSRAIVCITCLDAQKRDTIKVMVDNRTLYLAFLIVAAAVALAAAAWFFYGQKGPSQPSPDAAAQQAAEETAKSENPFKSESPLSAVEANPFEKTKKVLNPFEI